MTAPRIVVVGAGLAGLAAAWRLRERGCRVRVLERAAGVGGRARHQTREGWCFDCGAHRVSAADRQLLGLARDAGAEPALLPLRPFLFTQLRRGAALRGDPVDWRGVARLPGLRLVDALRLLRLERILRRFGPILDAGEPERGERLDDRSVADFARLYFGRSALERWIGPFTASASLGDEEETSRLLFLVLLAARRFAPEGSFRAGLGALAERLAAGLDTRVGAAVRSVEAAGGGALVVGFEGDAGEERIEADAVIVATRAGAARRIAAPLLASAERELLAQVRYAASIVLHLALERPLLRLATRVEVPHAEGWPVETVVVDRGGEHGRAPRGRGLASLVARDAWSRARLEAPDEAVEKELLAVLERLAPGVGGAVRFTRIERFPESHPRFDVGRFRAIARLRRVGADRRAAGRRLYFAGDHWVLPTLEGAVTSGVRAAREVASDLGLGPAPGQSGSRAPKMRSFSE